jgi:AcrR family transcriptional regulator
MKQGVPMSARDNESLQERRTRRAHKRERVLAIARQLLVSVGFEDLSLRAVARGAGISPAGMYELFDSKEALLDALGAQSSAALSRSLRASLRGVTAPSERLVKVGLAYVRFARRGKDDFLSLFTRCSPGRRLLAQEVPADSFYAVLRGAVEVLLDAKRLQGADPRVVEGFAFGFWSLVHGMAMLQLTTLAGFQADFDDAARLVLQAQAYALKGWRPAAAGAAPSRARRR